MLIVYIIRTALRVNQVSSQIPMEWRSYPEKGQFVSEIPLLEGDFLEQMCEAPFLCFL